MANKPDHLCFMIKYTSIFFINSVLFYLFFLEIQDWSKNITLEETHGQCWKIWARIGLLSQVLSVDVSPITRPSIIWSPATQSPYTPLEPHRLPATTLLLSSSLYLSTPSLHLQKRLSAPPLPGALSHSTGLHTEPHCVCVVQSTQSGLILDPQLDTHTHPRRKGCVHSRPDEYTHTRIPSWS